MSWTSQEESRVAAIESKLNELQEALNSLATRRQINALLAILQPQITQLDSEIEQLEQTAIGPALEAHKVEPTAHVTQLDDRYFREDEHITSTDGIGDAGKPILLDSTGYLDPSFVSLVAEDHNTLSGLDVDSHTHYLLVDGSRALTGTQTVNNLIAVGDTTVSGLQVNDPFIYFGGTTVNYPAWKRSATTLVAMRADESMQTGVSCGHLVSTSYVRLGSASYLAWLSQARLYSPADGQITLTDNAGTDFDRLQFGGTSAGFPALVRQGGGLRVRDATNTSFATFEMSNAFGYTSVYTGSSGLIGFQGRSKILCSTDGDLTLTDTAATDFGLLQFGGTTSAFPALKRNGANLQVKLADNSDFTGLLTGSLNIKTSNPPASATTSGLAGQIEWDSGYIYVCTADDTWKRVALSTWP